MEWTPTALKGEDGYYSASIMMTDGQWNWVCTGPDNLTLRGTEPSQTEAMRVVEDKVSRLKRAWSGPSTS